MDIVVINGFLGSGKTSAISYILESNPLIKFALLINEFGEHDIDGKQLAKLNDRMVSINNGSIFCSCKSDKFVENMLELCQLDIDAIIIESSGFSNPASLLKLLDFIKRKSQGVDINIRNIITIICPLQYDKLIGNSTSYFNQVSISDVIVVNKIDLVNDDDITRMSKRIKDVNNEANIVKTEFGRFTYKLLTARDESRKLQPELLNSKDLSQQKITIELNRKIKKVDLVCSLEESSIYCLRVKGFISCVEGDFLVQVASGQVSLTVSEISDNKLVILYSSSESNRNAIINVFKKYKLLE